MAIDNPQPRPSNRLSSPQNNPYPSSPSSTASSDSEDDAPGPADPPRRGDDRNLRINPLPLNHNPAPALATPSAKIGAHPWPFNSLSPTINSNNPIQFNNNSQNLEHSNSLVQLSPNPIQNSMSQLSTMINSPTNLLSQTAFPTSSHPRPLSSSLPHEILIQILRSVSSTSDLCRALRVCKAWCQCGVELLWHKPTFPTTHHLIKMLVSLASKSQTFPYITFIRRLNFSGLAEQMTDILLFRLVNCTRLERLTLSGCNSITDDSIIKILKNSSDLVALDLSDCKMVTDSSIHAVGQYCKLLQGLNLSGCKAITDSGLQSLRHCRALRRLKLKYCEKITDIALIAVAVACPLLLEVDLVGCKLVTNASLWMLWKNSSHLRELSLSGCLEISDGGFPSASNCSVGADGVSHPILASDTTNSPEPSNQTDAQYNDHNSALVAPSHQFNSSAYEFIASLASHRRLEQSAMHFDHIRFLDLTSLAKLTDASLEGIIKHMPRIRNLVLAKCVGLTDEALNSICGLGKYLHYLHLGHVSSLTDRAVIRVARSCTRLRYIDLACCNNLTDMSVFELAQCLPRLKRIGLVRVTNITDQSVYTLVERTSLERIHLSYCDNITVGAIHWLLQRLHRLTHLSLTGVPAFRRTDLQAWCRAPPKDFNAHQRQAFCVYSGKGVNELRYYLAALYLSITSSHTRRGGGVVGASSNAGLDEENTNHLTLAAAPVGPNLAVFNSMPDPRTMAAAMAAARQQANPQLYGLGTRRRELRLPERAGRVALSDFLHQGPSGGVVNAGVISGNGQLLGLPSVPRQAARRHGHSNGDGGGPSNPIPGAAEGEPEGAMETEETEGAGYEGSWNGATQRSVNGTRLSALWSPIPLYSTPLQAVHERRLGEHLLVNGGSSSSTPSSNRASRLGAGGLEVSLDGLQHGHSNGHIEGSGGGRWEGTLMRRRSEVDMGSVAGGSGSGPSGSGHGGGGAGGGGGPDGVVGGGRLEVPDRMASVSPIEISDDERPPR